MSKNITFLNFAKGSAILWIVLFHLFLGHLSGLWAKFIYVGGSGVHLFFFLSGFGLNLSDQSVDVKSFYKKRFHKILIPYFLLVILSFVLDMLFNLFTHSETSKAYVLLGHLLLFKMFDNSIISSYGGHLWFMSTLIQLYLFFPVLQKISSNLTNNQFVAFSLITSISYWIIITYFNLNESRVFNSFFINYLWEFNLGFLIARMYKTKGYQIWETQPLYSFGVSAIAFTVMGLMTLFVGAPAKTFNDIPSFIGILFFTIFFYQFTRSYARPLMSFFNVLGTFSYELYLTHMLVIVLITKIIFQFKLNINNICLILYLPVIIASAWGYSIFLKRLQKCRQRG